jgi:hypothetical protein
MIMGYADLNAVKRLHNFQEPPINRPCIKEHGYASLGGIEICVEILSSTIEHAYERMDVYICMIYL